VFQGEQASLTPSSAPKNCLNASITREICKRNADAAVCQRARGDERAGGGQEEGGGTDLVEVGLGQVLQDDEGVLLQQRRQRAAVGLEARQRNAWDGELRLRLRRRLVWLLAARRHWRRGGVSSVARKCYI
jgi:hypothetical protein